MGWIMSGDMPIYLQLIEEIKIRIIAGVYKSGEKMPTVRELALEASVNPNTMQKALSELERMGLIFSQRTNGRYVTDNVEQIELAKVDLSKMFTDEYLTMMRKLGMSDDEIIRTVEKYRNN